MYLCVCVCVCKLRGETDGEIYISATDFCLLHMVHFIKCP